MEPEFICKTVKKVENKNRSIYETSKNVQDFQQLRQECLERGCLFEDPEFPAIDTSLFFSKQPDRHIEWQRPMEISHNPQFCVDNFSRFDVQQGELGDCWLLAAVANLTMYPNLFYQVVPKQQSFRENYAGIFHFRFWQYGRWVDVVVDDRLPTYDGQLIYLHSTETNEFWSALLEKAYAKLYGSYEALEGGMISEAMEDFTGGVTEIYEMDDIPPNLFDILLKAYERKSMIGCSINCDPNVLEAETPQGLIRGHAYSITCVKYVDIVTRRFLGKIPLLRIRNPWGNEAEWNGPWSDESPEWQFIPDEEKEELGLTFDVDGEFWMSFDDFKRYYTNLEICNLNPDSLTEYDLSSGKKKWEINLFEGEWVYGVTAGGCGNYKETFPENPQYCITLEQPDEDDDECTMIVALMQKNQRAQRSIGGDDLVIGFAIYHLDYPDRLPKPLDTNFFECNASVGRSPSFINLREVTCRFKLPPGTYCVIPSTFDPNEEGEFLLRIFSYNYNHMEENDEGFGIGEIDERLRDQPDSSYNEEQVWEFFRKVAGDDMEIDWQELKEILDCTITESVVQENDCMNTFISILTCTQNNNSSHEYIELQSKGFSKDVCRSMIAMFDDDDSGKLDFNEFKILWNNLKNWRGTFKLYDKDCSGSLDSSELRKALKSAGFKLNKHILNIFVRAYGGKNRKITFDNFIMCTVRLKTMIDLLPKRDVEHSGSKTSRKWVEMMLKL